MSHATVLDELAAAALRRAEVRSTTDLDTLYQRAPSRSGTSPERSAPGLSVISEIKRASPSAGFIREADPPSGVRVTKQRARAASPSSPSQSASGLLEDLDAARDATTLPVIRKDFTVDEAQVIEAGTRADAVLLIAALFDAAALPGTSLWPSRSASRRSSRSTTKKRRSWRSSPAPGSSGSTTAICAISPWTSGPSSGSRRAWPVLRSSPRAGSRRRMMPGGYATPGPMPFWWARQRCEIPRSSRSSPLSRRGSRISS